MLGVRRNKLVLSDEIGNVIYPIEKEEVTTTSVTKTGKTVERKKNVTKKGTPIVPLFHPAAYLRAMGKDKDDPLNWMDRQSFVNGLRLVAREARVEVDDHVPEYTTIETLEQALELCDLLETKKLIAFDTETSPQDTTIYKPKRKNALDLSDDESTVPPARKRPIPWVDRVLCISVSWEEGKAATIPWRKQVDNPGDPLEFFWDERSREIIRERLRRIFENPNIIKGAHNGIAFDKPIMRCDPSLRIKVKGLAFDGMLLHHLWDQERSHGLKSLCFYYTGLGNYEAALDEAKKKLPKGASYALLPRALLYRYAAADADGELRIINYLLHKIRGFDLRFPDNRYHIGMEKFYFNHVLPVARLASSMEEVGVPVNVARVRELRENYKKEIQDKITELTNLPEVREMLRRLDQEKKDKLTDSAKKQFAKLKKPRVSEAEYVQERVKKYFRPTVFNPGSQIQMPFLLFDVCGLPVLRYTSKGKPETGKKALELYDHPITVQLKAIRQVAAYRRWLKQQILDNLIESPDGRLHTSYLIIGTDTGRWSSQGPNLQNIPARGKRAKEIASIFEAPPGYAFVKADFGQAEFRLFAIYSGDQAMIDDIIDGMDIHSYIASQAYGVTIAEVVADKKAGGSMRDKAKNGVFLTIYGGQPARLAYELRVPLEVAQRLQDAFWGRYKRAKEWVEEIRSFARENGYTRSLFGRVNTFPGLRGSFGQARAKMERKASNSIIQGTASDLTCFKGTMLRKAFRQSKIDARVCLQIHDALVSLVPLETWRSSFELHKRVMEQPHDRILDVPMPIDQEIGFNLGELYDEDGFEKMLMQRAA